MTAVRLRRIALALTVAGTFTLAGGIGQASAASTAQRCGSLNGAATIDPGLTNTPTDSTLTAKGKLKNCGPTRYTGGAGAMVVKIPLNDASCLKLTQAQTLVGKGRIVWANDAVSRVTLKAATSSSDPTVAKISGKVTSGRFEGKLLTGKIKFTPVFSGTGAPCSPTNPLKKITFTNQIDADTLVPFKIYAP